MKKAKEIVFAHNAIKRNLRRGRRYSRNSSSKVPMKGEWIAEYSKMKNLRRGKKTTYQIPLPPAVAIFLCRRCFTNLTQPLSLLTDNSKLGRMAGRTLVPAGQYWPVTVNFQFWSKFIFAGQFAVALVDLVDELYHADQNRLIGCCGPTGDRGRNRICRCGSEIGTECSDCIFPHSVYLDPTQVRIVSQEMTTVHEPNE